MKMRAIGRNDYHRIGAGVGLHYATKEWLDETERMDDLLDAMNDETWNEYVRLRNLEPGE
jgi:hypothetical protein